jgi:hypothetical protein
MLLNQLHELPGVLNTVLLCFCGIRWLFNLFSKFVVRQSITDHQFTFVHSSCLVLCDLVWHCSSVLFILQLFLYECHSVLVPSICLNWTVICQWNSPKLLKSCHWNISLCHCIFCCGHSAFPVVTSNDCMSGVFLWFTITASLILVLKI